MKKREHFPMLKTMSAIIMSCILSFPPVHAQQSMAKFERGIHFGGTPLAAAVSGNYAFIARG
jgi:hypothetical protein